MLELYIHVYILQMVCLNQRINTLSPKKFYWQTSLSVGQLEKPKIQSINIWIFFYIARTIKCPYQRDISFAI